MIMMVISIFFSWAAVIDEHVHLLPRGVNVVSYNVDVMHITASWHYVVRCVTKINTPYILLFKIYYNFRQWRIFANKQLKLK